MWLNVFVNKIIPASVYRGISKEIHQNYKKPFPKIKSRYPIFVWPNELPIEGKINDTFREIKMIEEYLSRFTFPLLLLTCKPGGVIRKEKVEWFKKVIKDLTVKDVGNGIHFVQEDNPTGIANALIEWAKEKKLF
jgi:hypothetical protein